MSISLLHEKAKALEQKALEKSRREREDRERFAAEQEARRKTKADENRKRMPIIAEITDRMREVFGELKIENASENGNELGIEYEVELIGYTKWNTRVVTKR